MSKVLLILVLLVSGCLTTGYYQDGYQGHLSPQRAPSSFHAVHLTDGEGAWSAPMLGDRGRALQVRVDTTELSGDCAEARYVLAVRDEGAHEVRTHWNGYGVLTGQPSPPDEPLYKTAFGPELNPVWVGHWILPADGTYRVVLYDAHRTGCAFTGTMTVSLE